MYSKLDQLKSSIYDINALHAAISIMDWDQQTLMPKGGATARAEHIGILSRMAHQLETNDEIGKLIEECQSEANDIESKAIVRVCKRNYDHATKLPTLLVERKSKLSAQAHEEWVSARKANNFKAFAPTLTEMFEIAREEAELFGYKDHIYDALFDLYEEGATHAQAKEMFDTIKGPLSELVKEISAKPEPDDSALYGSWPENDQREFTLMLIDSIGFDLNRGRQDTAPHPFCTGWSIGDVRLTTRFKDYLPSSIFGSLHEAGHGMYEQGSPMKWDRLPIAGGVSLGVHESQSRTWENIVGRSKAFWTYFLPKLHQKFPATKKYGINEFLCAVNKVKPSLIRVEADEVTYNLHVIVRFELEAAILTGQLRVKDLPEAWNEKYREYLGVVPDNDANGCLQDVHWSMGSIGYFPTYSMGNLLSYQIWGKLQSDIPDVDHQISEGKFEGVLCWLKENIYSKGSLYTPSELILQVTGKPIGSKDYLDGLTAKYRDLYSM